VRSNVKIIAKGIKYKNNNFLLVEETSNIVQLLQPLIFPQGKNIYYIQPQSLNILIDSLKIGYNYIGIYIDFSDMRLKYKIIDNDTDYNALTNRIKLSVLDDTYHFIFFGIALNNITYMQ